MDKLRGLFQKLLAYIPKGKSKAMKYIEWYAASIVFCFVFYHVIYIADWLMNGKPDVREYEVFIKEIPISGAFVAAIGFIGRSFVDTDNDGIPDAFETDEKKEKKCKTL